MLGVKPSLHVERTQCRPDAVRGLKPFGLTPREPRVQAVGRQAQRAPDGAPMTAGERRAWWLDPAKAESHAKHTLTLRP